MTALGMQREERRTRMRAMRRRVLTNDVQHWANSFLRSLKRQAQTRTDGPGPQEGRR